MRKKQRLFTPLDLQILVGVAAGKTQAGIANELELAQPAISKHLCALERAAGLALVHRNGKRLRLTSTGRYVAEAAKEVLALLDEIEATVTGQGTGRGGFVRIIASSTPGGYALPEAVAQFLRVASDIKVEMDVHPLSGIWRTFADGAYDFAVVPYSSFPQYVLAQPLYDDPMVIFAHPSHPLTRSRSVTVDDLLRERLIGRFIVDTGYWHGIFRGKPARRPNRVEIVPIEAVKTMVKGGAGIGILYQSTVRHEIDAGRLCRLNVVDVDLRRKVCLVRRHNLTQTAVAKQFASFALEYFAGDAK